MLRFKCYGLRFEWLKLKFNNGFYPREGRYQGNKNNNNSSCNIPVHLRVSRRAVLVAFVRSGPENERSWVAHMFIIPAQRILSF